MGGRTVNVSPSFAKCGTFAKRRQLVFVPSSSFARPHWSCFSCAPLTCAFFSNAKVFLSHMISSWPCCRGQGLIQVTLLAGVKDQLESRFLQQTSCESVSRI